MTQIFGNFIEQLPQNRDALELTFIPSSRPIKQRWRNNRLSAYFVADYFSTFLPVSDDEPDSQRRKEESKGAVSYVANELLENAMKFNDETASYPIKFGIHFIEESEKVTVVLFVTNSISVERQAKFILRIKEILTHDPQELYIQKLESSVELEDSNTSGLGLLTMINDYSATLGWKFTKIPFDSIITTVTTMAQITI